MEIFRFWVPAHMHSDWIADGVVLLTFAVGFALQLRSYKRDTRALERALSYTVLVNRLVWKSHLASDEIAILFRGQKVNNASLVTISIKNTGSSEIRREDFDTELEIHCESTVEPLQWNLQERSPANLDIAITPALEKKSIVRIAPGLLNAGDEFSISAIVTTRRPKFEVQGRIAGIKEIQEVDSFVPKPKKPFPFSQLLTASLLLVGTWVPYYSTRHPEMQDWPFTHQHSLQFSSFMLKIAVALVALIGLRVVALLVSRFGVEGGTPSRARRRQN